MKVSSKIGCSEKFLYNQIFNTKFCRIQKQKNVLVRKKCAGAGIEPVPPESQSDTLPLDHPAVQSRFREFSAMAEIGKKHSGEHNSHSLYLYRGGK